jgi:hypothetical protein
MRRALALLAVVLGWPTLAIAQGDCFPGSESNEAKTLAIFSVPLAFGRGNAPELFSGFTAGLELSYLPQVSDSISTPTVCRPGKAPSHGPGSGCHYHLVSCCKPAGCRPSE